jgi:hypothetical protein
MMDSRLGRPVVTAVLALFVAACTARTPTPAAPPATAASPPELLFVQQAHRVSLADGVLTLGEVNPATVFFSDRPQRIVGHVPVGVFVADWGRGGAESFAADPPNALLAFFGPGNVREVVVELSNPRLRGHDLTYDARVLQGPARASGGPATLFLDASTIPWGPPPPATGPSLQVRRPYYWQSYVWYPGAPENPPTGPYSDLANPDYYGQNPYQEGYRSSPPPAYTWQ